MKKFLPLLFVALFSGIHTNCDSQVILNSGAFVPWQYTGPYTVPSDKTLIITHLRGLMEINDQPYGCWDCNDGADKMVHMPVAGGSYLIQINSGLGGLGTEALGYLIDSDGFGVGINETNFDEENTGFSIYPNPATHEVSVFADVQGNWNVTVYDMMGSVVIQAGANAPVKTIDTSSLSAGTYIVSAKTNGNHVGSSKLIIE